jgi:nucleoside-diphosphate-sugar epimerase
MRTERSCLSTDRTSHPLSVRPRAHHRRARRRVLDFSPSAIQESSRMTAVSLTGARILVTGAGGFIGHHLTKFLTAKGFFVRGADLKFPEYERSPADEFEIADLREQEASRQACRGIDLVFHLAANMGGIGFTSSNKAAIMHDSSLIDLHLLEAARRAGVRRLLYSSTACVYPLHLQERPDVAGLKEEDAYPADAEDGYGWQKLFTERQCRHYREDYGLDTRIVRFHNIFGPLGTYDGGREKAPAAICRKLALAKPGDTIEVWGDGLQTRSYCYVDDCVDGIWRLMQSDWHDPINLGQDRLVSVDELVDIVATIARKHVVKHHDMSKPQGVRGRNSDNTRIARVLGWSPRVSLEEGLHRTYDWIVERLRAEGRLDGRG